MKKGFSLLETVIAIAVIMIISVSFFSLSTFANTQFKKAQIKEHGILMIENVKSVFDNNTFVDGATFSVDKFSNNLQWATGLMLTYSTATECFITTCKVNPDGTLNENGLGTYQFTLQKTDENIVLSAKILYKDKQIYSMPNYTKEVLL